jgi:hypothetical protein
MHYKLLTLPALTVLAAITLAGCGGGGDTSTGTDTGTNTNTGSESGSGTGSGTATATTAPVLCSYSQSVFNSSPSVNATSTANWSCNSTSRMLSANGLPDHGVGVFPNTNNPNAISAQNVSAALHLTPTTASTTTQRGGALGDTGYVLNGVKIDAATAGSCDNTGSNCGLVNNSGPWSIEALGQTAFKFGTDSNNAHVQPNGAYHYHGMPEGFVTALNKGTAMALIGWAADGFPIYARYGYRVANDATSGTKLMASSYRLKTSPGANRPATTTYAMGTFSQDYEYVAGYGDLDDCNGRVGATPEFPSGIYHYFATDTYPYLQRCVKGTL